MDRHQSQTQGRARRTAADWRQQAAAFSRSKPFRMALQFFAGFALSFSAMGSGIAPFGLSYVAMCPQGELLAAAGAFIGYTLAYGTGGLTYAAAVLICYACRVVLSGTRVGRSPYLMPLCAFAALVAVKSVVAARAGLLGVVTLLCEAVLCMGFCLLFSANLDEGRRPLIRTGPIWGRLAMLVAVLLIFAPLRIFGDISPARAVAAFAVMAVACLCGSALGAGAGVALGACMDLAAGQGPFFAAAYGFAGLIGGIAGQRGRFACAVSYVLANCVATLWGFSHPSAIPGLFECFIASVVFVLMPDGLFGRLTHMLERLEPPVARPASGRALAAGRLEAVSAAIGELGTAMDGFVQGLRRHNDDITTVYDRAADRVCRRCPTASICWERDYMSTQGALNDAVTPLRQKNALQPDDLPAHFSARCAHVQSFCGAINEEYRAYLRRQANGRRDAEAKRLMSRQYHSLQGILSDVADTVSAYPEYFPALEGRVRTIAKAYCTPGRVSVYTLSGRLHAEITLKGEHNSLSDPDAFMQSLELALMRRFWPPQPIQGKDSVILRMSERERLTATVSCAMRKKPGEAVSGDTSAHLHTDDGRAVVLLSDGMGTGEAAGALSGKVIELISGFVRSGCSLRESTRAVLPVLSARFEQWGFVTLDLLEINLFTGQCDLVKYGAVPSYVLEGGRCRKLGQQALPAGLDASGEPKSERFRLQSGDRVVMMSDGVWEHGDVEGILKASGDLPAAQLGGALIRAASDAGAVDDMSVLVITVASN